MSEQDVLNAFDRPDQYRKRPRRPARLSDNRRGPSAMRPTQAAHQDRRGGQKRQAALAAIVRARNDAQVTAPRRAGMSPHRALEALWMGVAGALPVLPLAAASRWARKESNRALLVGGIANEIQRGASAHHQDGDG